jgi:hypothetical protein
MIHYAAHLTGVEAHVINHIFLQQGCHMKYISCEHTERVLVRCVASHEQTTHHVQRRTFANRKLTSHILNINHDVPLLKTEDKLILAHGTMVQWLWPSHPHNTLPYVNMLKQLHAVIAQTTVGNYDMMTIAFQDPEVHILSLTATGANPNHQYTRDTTVHVESTQSHHGTCNDAGMQ